MVDNMASITSLAGPARCDGEEEEVRFEEDSGHLGWELVCNALTPRQSTITLKATQISNLSPALLAFKE